MSRPYQIVVFGATGYTGQLTAAYIAKNLPTDIRWAVAGRSRKKLENVVANCKEVNPERDAPGSSNSVTEIEICNLDDAELGDLARKTEILVSTVGPYAIYGEHAFKACAENGTHYLDVTGESTFVHKMIQKYDVAAKRTGAIMIPQIGLESAPPDFMTLAIVSLIRKECSAPTADVIISVHELRGAPSGGTLATVLAQNEVYSPSELMATSKPFALSPVPGPQSTSSASLFSKIFGVRAVADLGILTTSIAGVSDIPIVQRSWGLLGGSTFYGPNFHFEEYMKARNYVTGILWHFSLVFGALALLISPFRWLVRKFIFQPGQGPSVEAASRERVEYRGVGVPDKEGEDRTAFAKFSWEGGMYDLTATFLGQACLTLLKDDVVAKKLGGGVLTPATLGQPFIDRLVGAGMKLEVKMWPAGHVQSKSRIA